MGGLKWDKNRKRDIGTFAVALVVGAVLLLTLGGTWGVLVMLALVWAFYLSVGRKWERDRPPEERARMGGVQHRGVRIGLIVWIVALVMVLAGSLLVGSLD